MPDEEFDQEESFGDVAPAAPKKSSGKFLLLLLPLLLVQAGGAYYLVMKYLRPRMPEKEVVEEEAPVEEEVEKMPFELHYALDDMTANIFDGARTRFLVFNATLETDNPGAVEEMSKRDRQLKDLFLREMAVFPLDMLMDVTARDSIGKYMTQKVNDILISNSVRKIYFDQWIVN